MKAAGAPGARRSRSSPQERLRRGLARLAELVEELSEELERALESEPGPAERSRVCADLERLVRSSEKLRGLMGELAPRRAEHLPRTLAELVKRYALGVGAAANGPEPPPEGSPDRDARKD